MKSHYTIFPGDNDSRSCNSDHSPDHNSVHNDSDWLIHSDASIGQQAFLQQAHTWATALPEKKYIVLLTQERLNFVTGFVAAQLKQQTVLLPSNNSSGAITEIIQRYPDSYCLVDEPIELIDSDAIQINCNDFQTLAQPKLTPETFVDPQHIAAVAFTSGTTGKAKPYPKTWHSLVQGAHLAKQRFKLDTQHSIVATVPSQHMYGLETTVMVPLIVGSKLYAERPFFPEDIRLALEKCSTKRVLVTTPIHLRACVVSGLKWPKLEMIISATAPLHEELLQQATDTFEAPVLEIYGCTEAGSLASRDPLKSPSWTLYDDFRIRGNETETIVSAPHLSEEVLLSDVVKIVEHNQFLLLGRHNDMVNIAGKRASLNDLNLKLNAIKGVEDGIFILPDDDGKVATRLSALVVALELDEADILAELSHQIDSVFLPRPFYKVAALPRNQTGKITREALSQLIEAINKSNAGNLA